jgi:hypothetical protein
MKNKPIHVVVTTINSPHFLNEYYENIKKYGHLDEVLFWIIGDNKTPADSRQICDDITKKGLEVRYLSIDDQDVWGKNNPELYKRIPYNNEARRNLGYMMAYENECQIMISIDDDNFPTDSDFIGKHIQTGASYNGDLYHDDTGYFNVCEFLVFQPSRDVYPRGFPFELRNHKNDIVHISSPAQAKIGLTEGLWFLEPDIDAITWLNGTVHSTAYNGPDQFVLAQNTWSPINTQNTSVVRELIPAYLCVPMGTPMPWGRIERYGDILGGYFTQAIINNSDYYIAFGLPIVEHRRNPHSYINDLQHEYWGMLINDWLLKEIHSFSASANSITDRIYEFSEYLINKSELMDSGVFPNEAKDFLYQTSITFKLWTDFFVKCDG